MIELLFLEVIVLGAHAVETITGFGATVIAVALGAAFMGLDTLIPTLVMVALVQSLYLVLRGFSHIRWKLLLTKVLPYGLPGLAAGAILFAFLAKGFNLVAVGEESGNLAQLMLDCSETMERRMDGMIKGALTILEPVLILAVGCLIGLMAMATVLPAPVAILKAMR